MKNKTIMTCKATLLSLLVSPSLYADETVYPLQVNSCDHVITFNEPPKRAVFHDLNMTQMALALGLQTNMVGVSGVSGWYKTTKEFNDALGNIPEISNKYLTLESLINVNPDFLFAGWNYGLKMGSELTPDNISRFSINTLVLSESCAHTSKKRDNANMNLLYDDILKLGEIFNKQDKAEQLVNTWKQELAVLKDKIGDQKKKKVFLYDSGTDKPFTSGKFAMPEALINAAGGINVMHDAPFSWATTSWESVAVNNPEMIILVDYSGHISQEDKSLESELESNPIMKETNAVKNKNYLTLSYGEITPGPNNIQAIKKIAATLYPEAGININE
ncbi:ABC transporter substrate-binding protein [Photobacterium damselae]|uniref:ABC transporter substrate-binding protein n=1 Tax=Photobacterium damselae TaxID=38293 RepID=UPI001F3D45AA|nr:ABC transporter substrate-binding protein [Photobacterium damselae]UKA12008.1 ABC transporter substrate-binding protein [Photobacterium damselae subsp. damselae]